MEARSLASDRAELTRSRDFGTCTRMTYLWVALGGALGSVARYWLSGVVAERVGETFPWGTIFVNVTGSFVIGFFGGLTGPEGRLLVDPAVRIFFMVGICGGYTTFSSLSVQTLALARERQWRHCGAQHL